MQSSDLAMPDSPADVIVADPPWAYHQKHKRGLPYPTMTPDELRAMKIPVAENALIFMWTTGPHFPQAVDLMKAWGFDYVTVAFVWEKTFKNGKPVCGMGFYTRSCCEFVLLGRRGVGVSKWIEDHSINQLIVSPKREHSRKPEEFWVLINRLLGQSPHLRKLELFARERRPGWEAWGNDVDHFSATADPSS